MEDSGFPASPSKFRNKLIGKLQKSKRKDKNSSKDSVVDREKDRGEGNNKKDSRLKKIEEAPLHPLPPHLQAPAPHKKNQNN